MTAPLSELLDLARSAALAAGELIRTRRAEGVSVAALKSSPVDVVTAADRESEALIRGLIGAARPDDGFLGEEGSDDYGASGLTWVVDPIDGTVNYLYGIPSYAVSIAVVEGEADPASWTALAACVVNPAIGEVFTATRGGGACLGDTALHVNADVPLETSLIGTGFSYTAEQRAQQAAILAQLLPQVRDIRRAGAAALDLCAVAAGRLDGYFERGIHPWDHAAGGLIAAEAGAKVGGLHGAPAGRRLTLAAAPALYRRLEAALAAAGLED